MTNAMLRVDPDDLKTAEMYKLLIGSIIPRPIAWVTTMNSAGALNLAPFSFFNGVSSNPPCLSLSIARKPDGTKKDTLRNIEENGELVVNSAQRKNFERIVQTGASYPYGVSEADAVNADTLPSERVAPPRIDGCAISYECKVYKLVEIGDGSPGSSTLVIARILLIHYAEDVYTNGKVDHTALDPLSRLGGASYSTLGTILTKPIPEL